MEGCGEDTVGAVDALLDALEPEDCVVGIDDAHHASRQAAVLVTRIGEQLRGTVRLVVLARQLPVGAERLRRADALWLGASELAMTPAEVMTMCNAGFGLEVVADQRPFPLRCKGSIAR